MGFPSLIKPPMWTVSPGLVEPKWGQFHRDCVGAWLLNEGVDTSLFSGIIDWNLRRKNFRQIDNTSGDITAVVSTSGRALSFSGDNTNDRLQLGSITASNPLSLSQTPAAGRFTIICRAQINTSPFAPRFIDKSNAGNGKNGYSFAVLTTGGNTDRLTLTHQNSAGSQQGQFFSPNNFVQKHATNAATYAVRVNSTIEADFFRSDSEAFATNIVKATVANTTGNPWFGIVSDTADCAIGNWNHTLDRMWAGRIEFVYIFDAWLTDYEIKRVFLDPFGPFRMADEVGVVVGLLAVGPFISDYRFRQRFFG